MRRTLSLTIALLALVTIALPAAGANTKFTFSDVTLPDGQVGEIEAGVKLHKNKSDSVTCAYFTDDYQQSLGYYFDFHEPAPTDPADVLEVCLEEFDERNV